MKFEMINDTLLCRQPSHPQVTEAFPQLIAQDVLDVEEDLCRECKPDWGFLSLAHLEKASSQFVHNW